MFFLCSPRTFGEMMQFGEMHTFSLNLLLLLVICLLKDCDPMGWKPPSSTTIWENFFWNLFQASNMQIQNNWVLINWNMSMFDPIFGWIFVCVFCGREMSPNFWNWMNIVVIWNDFYFHPYLGRWSNSTNIFQMGWFQPPTSCALDCFLDPCVPLPFF